MAPLDPGFSARLSNVQARLAAALEKCDREPNVTLVAITKKFSAETVKVAYAGGLRHFGENYVQEFAEKQPQLGELHDARFHFVGHLQSNKTRLAVSLFQTIQTADSRKLIQRLDSSAKEAGKNLEVLLEIKLSDEQSKSGADPAEIASLLEEGARCSHLRVIGLMTMPPWSLDAETSRPYFRQLASLAKIHGLHELSMGMSNDFEVAVEEGATMIRVGTALFGARPKPSPASPE